METLASDIRYGMRRLAQAPGFTLVAVATLALGIGANTAMFSLVNGILLRPLPYLAPEQLVRVAATTADVAQGALAPADFIDFQHASALAGLAGYRATPLTLTAPDREATRLDGAQVTVGFFDVLGIPAARGRSFGAATDTPAGERLLVISDAFWRRHFGADLGVVGRRLAIEGEATTLVGVMPAGFDWPARCDGWVLSPRVVPTPPLAVGGDLLANRDTKYFDAIGRLAAGVDANQAQAALGAVARRLEVGFPTTNHGRGVRVSPLHDSLVGDVRTALLLLQAAVGCVLLIACANVAGLLLARGITRRREIAVRTALGASRGRLARQLLTESATLGVAGGAAGLLLGVWAVDALRSLLPVDVPRLAEIVFDARVAAWACGLSLVSGALVGLVPAWRGAGSGLAASLREADSRGTGGRDGSRARQVLVVGQLALTLVLLVGAALLINSFVRLQRVPVGFQTERVFQVSLPLPDSRYPDMPRQADFYARVLDALATQPQIERAALVFPEPLRASSASANFTIEGRPSEPGQGRPFAAIASASPELFHTLGVPLRQGRDFGAGDTAQAGQVAIISETLARRYFPAQNPLLQRINLGDPGDPSDSSWFSVVGVVGDVHGQGLDSAPPAMIYLPYRQFCLPLMSLIVRTSGDATAVNGILRGQLQRLDPELPLEQPTTLAEVVTRSIATVQFRTLLLAAFASLALGLAGLGIYGLISQSMAQRVRECGIRIALGATRAQLLRPLLREGLRLASAGVALGLAGSWAASRLLSGLLFEVQPTDPVTFVAGTALLLGIALLATYIPARRVARLDPIAALRAD